MSNKYTIGNMLNPELKVEDGLPKLDSLDYINAGFNASTTIEDIEDAVKTMSGVLDSIEILVTKEDEEGGVLRLEDARNLPMISNEEEAEKASSFSIKELLSNLWKWISEALKMIDQKIDDFIISGRVMFSGVEKRLKSLEEEIKNKDAAKFKPITPEYKKALLGTVGCYILRTDTCDEDTFVKVLTSLKDIRKIAGLPTNMVKGVHSLESKFGYNVTEFGPRKFITYINNYGEFMKECFTALPKFITDLGENMDSALVNGNAEPSSGYQAAKKLVSETLVFSGMAYPYSCNGAVVKYMSYGVIAGSDQKPVDVKLIGYNVGVNTSKVLSSDKVVFTNISLDVVNKIIKGMGKLDIKDISKSLSKTIKVMRKEDPTKDILSELGKSGDDLSKEDKLYLKRRIKLTMSTKKDIANICKTILVDNIALSGKIAKACTVVVNNYEDKK